MDLPQRQEKAVVKRLFFLFPAIAYTGFFYPIKASRD